MSDPAAGVKNLCSFDKLALHRPVTPATREGRCQMLRNPRLVLLAVLAIAIALAIMLAEGPVGPG